MLQRLAQRGERLLELAGGGQGVGERDEQRAAALQPVRGGVPAGRVLRRGGLGGLDEHRDGLGVARLRAAFEVVRALGGEPCLAARAWAARRQPGPVAS